MVCSKWSVEMAKAGTPSTESSVSAPPVNDDGSGNLSDPVVPNLTDLQSLFDEKQKECEVLEEKNVTLTFDLVRERIKTKDLLSDRGSFRASCKQAASQSSSHLPKYYDFYS
jgi:hypothetical protein